MSQKQEGNQDGEIKVARSAAEIQKRIEDLNAKAELNKFQVNIGTYASPVMVQTREYEQFIAKLDELRWLTGEDIKITDGIE